MTQKEYRDALHAMAVNNKLIANDGENSRFFELVRAVDPYTGLWDKDFEDALRDRIKINEGQCAMIIEAMHERTTGREQALTVKTVPSGCFMIIKKAKLDSSHYAASDVSQALADCTEVGKQLLSWMQEEMTRRYNGAGSVYATFMLDWSELTISPFGPLENSIVGQRFDFVFKSPSNRAVVYNSAHWNNPL